MAPVTRRSVGGSSAPILATTPSVAPKRRGRPPKVQTPAAGSTSVSTAATPAGSVSDGGEYSTPATSNVVTPDPSVMAKPSTRDRVRSRLIVELPDSTSVNGTDSKKNTRPGSLRSRVSSRRAVKISRRPASHAVDDSEDDLLDDGYDSSPDAVLARKLQREEDKKFAAHIAQPSSSKGPSRRITRPSLVDDSEEDEEDDDDDYVEDVIHGLESAQPDRKGKAKVVLPPSKNPKSSRVVQDESDSEDFPMMKCKGKAVAKPTATKRKSPHGRGRFTIIGDSEDDEEDDEPLSVSAGARSKSTPARKKLKIEEDDMEDKSVPPSRDSSSLSIPATSDEDVSEPEVSDSDDSDSDDSDNGGLSTMQRIARNRRAYRETDPANSRRARKARATLEHWHPALRTMWTDLKNMPILKAGKAEQPKTISRQLKPFQLEGLAWMKAMESGKWRGGLLGDEMGLGKTIQAVSLIMSDYPAKSPSLVLVPPVALMQWTAEIDSYTDGTLKSFVFHGTNSKTKNITTKELRKFDIILMSYNSLESVYRKQEKGFKRKAGLYKETSAIHSIKFHRVILDEAHCIKTRTTMTAKACFALKVEYRWCLTGTPLQNRIGEFFSLLRFLNVTPFTSYFCKNCPCDTLEWSMDEDGRCQHCNHGAMRHVSVFNQELLNPIQKYGNRGQGAEAFQKLRLMTERIMLRRLKKDHTNSMELPVKEIYVDRQFFGEEENDFANSIMTSGQRKFNTYVAQGVLLNNYANIFGLIMQMRQVADHPDLILKKSGEGGQNILVCCICDEPAEEAIRSRCKHDFCRACAKSYVNSQDQPDCPRCHIPLSIDLEQPEIEQDETMVKKNSIINRIKMENWTSSSKIELLVHELHKLRSDNTSHKSIIFSQFTTMLQLIEWRLRRAGITTVMLDGSMTPAQRQASINHFMTNVDVECFLVSLKAGGVALNLTEASRVFIVDPWWNPAAEWQSADRCHRIGQTRPCTITRLCIEDSVESRMVLLQEKKTNMINSTINSDDAAMESLTPEDLQFLFRGN